MRALFCFALLALVACDVVPATNRFDAEAPADLQAPGRVRGRVLTRDGTPIATATVTLFRDGAASDSVDSDVDGAFDFSDLAADAYTLDVSHPAHLATTRALFVDVGEDAVVDIVLVAIDGDEAGVGHLTGVVQRGSELSRPEAAQDHSGIVVELAGSGIRTATNAVGRFDLFVQPGSYDIAASAPGHAPQSRAGVIVDADVTTELEAVVLVATPGSIAGTVALEGGVVPVDATVAVDGTGLSALTDAAGAFLITDVPAGARALTITRADFATQNVAGVVVVAGDRTVVAPTRLSAARGTIEGRVDLVGRSNDGGVVVGLTGTAFAAVTNEQGTYRIVDVPVGTYELTASRDGFQRGVAGVVEVDADAVTAVPVVVLGVSVGDFDIDGGAAFTRDAVVRLSLSNPDAVQVRASEDASFADAALGDTAFEDFVGDVDFTLSAGDGAKTVFVQFADDQGVPGPVFSSSIVLDATAPAPPPGAAAIVINGGASFVNDAVVVLSLLAVDATSGVTSMRLAHDDTTVAAPQPFATTQVFALAVGADGARDVFVRFIDAAGNESAPFAASVVLDTTAPTLSAVSLNAGAAFSSSSVAELTVTATDAGSGVTRMAVSTNGGFVDGVFEAFVSPRTFFLSPGEGTRSAFVKVIDAAGNESDVVSDAIVVDGSAPADASVVINGGAAQTNNPTLSLALGATGATQMRVSFDGVFDTEAREPFVANKTVTLSAGDGVRTVFVRCEDDAGNVGDVVSDTIVFDTVAPAAPLGVAGVVIDGGAAFSNNGSALVTLTLAAADATTSVVTMQVAVDGAADTEAFVPFQSTLVTALQNTDGAKTVQVRFRDAAGNTSAPVSASIVLDREPPTVSSVSINAAAATTRSSNVAVAVAGADTRSGVAAMVFSTDAGFSSETVSSFTTAAVDFVLATGDGTRQVFVKLRDGAGNTSSAASDSIVVDGTPPQAVALLVNGGAVATNNGVVAVTLLAQDATQMRISVDGVFDTEPTEAFATSRSVTLSGDGTKTVFAVFQDVAGNVSGVVSDSIELDTVAPTTPTVSIDTPTPGFIASTTATLTLTNTNATRVKVRVVQDANCAAAAPAVVADFAALQAEAFASTRTVALPPNAPAPNSGPAPVGRCKHVQVLPLDDAGNTGTIVEARVELDQQPPDAPRIATASTVIAAADGATLRVDLAVDAIDHNFARCEFRNGGADFDDATPLLDDTGCLTSGTTCSFLIPLRQTAGTRTENRIELHGVDAAGNASVADLVIVVEDSDPPDAPATLTARPADQEVTLSWAASLDTDVAGYRVGYLPKNGAACPTVPASYVGASLADQGPSPIDAGLNTSFRFTGFSNNIELCFAVWAYDQTVVPGEQESTTATTTAMAPSEIGLVRTARITGSQLGIGAGLPRAIAMRAGMLYVAASGTGNGLVELDASDGACFALTNATAFANCTNLKKSGTTLTDPRDLKIHGSFAFVADGAGGTRVFRLQEGVAPVEVFTIPLAGGDVNRRAMAVAASGSFLAVGRSSSVVRAVDALVDIYNLDTLYQAVPTVPGVFQTITQDNSFGDPLRGIFGFTSLDFDNGRLAAGSRLFDVSIFGAFASTQPILGGAVVAMGGKYLYAANDDNGPDNDMHVVDMSEFVDIDPGAPVNNRAVVVSRSVGTASHRIEVAGPYVYVAGRHLLDVYDASDPRTLRYLTTYASNFTPDGGATPEFEKEVLRGSLAVDSSRIFFTGATVAELDVLQLGDPIRLEAIAAVDEPTGSADAVVADDVWVQPRTNAGAFGDAPLAVAHFGQLTPTVELENPAATSGTAVAVDGDQLLLIQGNLLDRVGRLHSSTGLGFSAGTTLPGGVVGGAAALRWPYALVTTGSSTDQATTLDVRVFDLRPIFGAMTQLSTTTVATASGQGWNLGPAGIAVHGGFVYVAVADNHFGATSGQAGQGLYRATFNPHTGALGAFARHDRPMSAIDPATVAHWLQSASTGALGTLREGAPFVSHVAVAVSTSGAPVLYLSDLAVHTQGLRADPRCSLMIHDVTAADPQAAWRATFVGRARIDDDAAAAFLARHPSTQVLPGFHAWVVDVDVVRAIAGFGSMGWLDGPARSRPA